MANTRIGEVGLNWRDKSYILRPSFYRLNQLDDCESYLMTASDCMHKLDAGLQPSCYELLRCITVLNELSSEPLPERLTGCAQLSIRRTGLVFKQGAMTIRAICTLAIGLLKHGMFGKPSRDRTELAKLDKRQREIEKFDLLKFVGLAIAPNGLGLSSSDAWSLTMIEFQSAIDAQFPLSEKEKAKIPFPDQELDKLNDKAMAAFNNMKNIKRTKPARLNK
jgi:hypothetical protein